MRHWVAYRWLLSPRPNEFNNFYEYNLDLMLIRLLVLTNWDQLTRKWALASVCRCLSSRLSECSLEHGIRVSVHWLRRPPYLSDSGLTVTLTSGERSLITWKDALPGVPRLRCRGRWTSLYAIGEFCIFFFTHVMR